MRTVKKQMLWLVAFLMAAVWIGDSEAFQSSSNNNHKKLTIGNQAARLPQSSATITAATSTTTTTLFAVKKGAKKAMTATGRRGITKKKINGAKPTEREQQPWDFNLFLLYLTPWKNPNSIFLYLLLTLYLLGKYSESQH